MITLAFFVRRVTHRQLSLAAAVFLLISQANGQEKTTDLLLGSSCERVLLIALPMFETRDLPLHHTATCAGCFEGSTAKLHDAAGNPVSTTTAYKRYVDHKYFPHASIFRWYTERDFHAVAHLIAVQEDTACKISLVFSFDFYGIELIAGLPIDGDRMEGKSNLRLESEYLDYLKKRLRS